MILLAADLPVKAPFACPRKECGFVAIDHAALVKHYGSYHEMADQYLSDYMATCGKKERKENEQSEEGKNKTDGKLTRENHDLENSALTNSANAIARGQPRMGDHPTGLECRLCEPGTTQQVIKHNADFYKHLSEVHFVENLLEDVISDVPYNVKPFKMQSARL